MDRLNYGTNTVENGALVSFVKHKGICLTCCPTSNSFVVADWQHLDISHLFGQAVKVTIKFADPSSMCGYVDENLETLREGGFSNANLVQLQRNTSEISWVLSTKRDRFLTVLEDYARGHEKQ